MCCCVLHSTFFMYGLNNENEMLFFCYETLCAAVTECYDISAGGSQRKASNAE